MVKFDGRIIDSVAMNFTEPSTFQGQAVVKQKGDYEIVVYAYDPITGNTGVDRQRVTVF